MADTKCLPISSISKPWEYNLDFAYTKKVWAANNLAAKVTRGSVLGIAALALAESISEVVKLFFKLLGNAFRLYNFSIFKSKEMPLDLKTGRHLKIPPKITLVGLSVLGLGVFVGRVIYNLTSSTALLSESLSHNEGVISYFAAGYIKVMQYSNIILGLGAAGVGLYAGRKICRRYHLHLPNVRNLFHVFSYIKIPGFLKRKPVTPKTVVSQAPSVPKAVDESQKKTK